MSPASRGRRRAGGERRGLLREGASRQVDRGVLLALPIFSSRPSTRSATKGGRAAAPTLGALKASRAYLGRPSLVRRLLPVLPRRTSSGSSGGDRRSSSASTLSTLTAPSSGGSPAPLAMPNMPPAKNKRVLIPDDDFSSEDDVEDEEQGGGGGRLCRRRRRATSSTSRRLTARRHDWTWAVEHRFRAQDGGRPLRCASAYARRASQTPGSWQLRALPSKNATATLGCIKRPATASLCIRNTAMPQVEGEWHVKEAEVTEAEGYGFISRRLTASIPTAKGTRP